MAAPAAEPIGTPIVTLFRPSTRFRDTFREQLDDDNDFDGFPERFTEMELLPHLTLQEILAAGTKWEDFYRFLGEDQIVWMTPAVYVSSHENSYIYHHSGDPVVLNVSDDDDDCLRVHVTEGTASAAATATCDLLVTLLATTDDGAVWMQGNSDVATAPLPVSAVALSAIFQENRDLPRTFTVGFATLNEEQIRALETASSPDVEVQLHKCSLSGDAACREAFVECLQSDGCPIKLKQCTIDCQVLATALAGNSRVTSLRLPHYWGWEADVTRKGLIFRSFAENKGLVHLDLYGLPISDENLSVLCQSLQVHPTLTSLDLRDTRPRMRTGFVSVFSDEQKAQRTSLVAEMMQTNTLLQTIHNLPREKDQQIYSETILPRLETNRFRPRVLAVKKTVDRPFREKVLGRALHCVRSNPNLVWMFLSQNVDAFVRSGEEEENSNEDTVSVEESVAVAGGKRKRSMV
jgi:hypothetical protein